ncbi:CPBP family intramembrane metalloprotease [Paenibacillaceae bacterium]|nr:CPBP family intramembrane metalloprotease [Paenibacillaceae bacterium]
MFNFCLWMILIVICVPGVWLITHHSVNELHDRADNNLSRRALMLLLIGQTLVIVALSAAAGIYFGAKIGIVDIFLAGLSHGTADWTDFGRQVRVGTIAGVICTAGWLMSYYGFIRSRTDRESVLISEKLRQTVGLSTRITSGGITEEIIFRWGLLSFVMWLISLVVSSLAAAFWIAIVITGVLFGLAHLPGLIEKGCKPSPMLISSAIIGNLWVAIFCGYLLWQYGLIAAIIVHILFHILWYPFDRVAFRKSYLQE